MAARCGAALRRWAERVVAPDVQCWSAHVEPTHAPHGCELSENGRAELPRGGSWCGCTQLLNAGVGAQRVGELRRARLADRDVVEVQLLRALLDERIDLTVNTQSSSELNPRHAL